MRVSIEHLSQKGQGVAPIEGKRSLYLPGTWPGDVIELDESTLDTPQPRFEIIVSSPYRIPTRPCPHQGSEKDQCGGCPWMPFSYESQLEQKQKRIDYALSRHKVSTKQLKINPIWPAPQTESYRNRAQLKTDGEKLGYLGEKSHELVDISNCAILNDSCQTLLQELRQKLPNPSWKTSDQPWTSLEIDDTLNANEISPHQSLPFRQGNSDQNQRMQAWVFENFKDQNKEQTIVELFCGAGNFTLTLAELGFQKIVGIESSEQAIQKLRSQNKSQIEALVCDLTMRGAWSLFEGRFSSVETLLLNPPRAGLKNKQGFRATFPKLKQVFYVSCDPESFAKDVSFFEKQGLALKELQPLDQFPHTSHVEILGRLGTA